MKAMVENQKATAGGTYANVTVTHSGVMPAMTDKEAEATYKARIADLEGKLAASEDACKALQSHVKTLEAEIKGGGGGSGGRMNVENEVGACMHFLAHPLLVSVGAVAHCTHCARRSPSST